MDSGAEKRFAELLDDRNISWNKNSSECFLYSYEGKLKKYYPDFYLPDLNIWVEIKGKKYIEKWLPEKLESVERSGVKIYLIMSEELNNSEKVLARITGLEPALCPS